jgi:PAS domain-containing protein
MQDLLQPADFDRLLAQDGAPSMVLDSAFRIVAQNDAHMRVTMTKAENTVGKSLFEVFPDNPNDSNAAGLADLRRSLVTVIRTRAPDVMPTLKYDIKRPASEGGGFEMRYWRVTNTPILGEDGFVRYIVNRAEDVTAELR